MANYGDLTPRPKIVGYFSVDEDRNYLPGASGLMYFKPPTSRHVRLDLNKGIESAVKKSADEDGRISHLLEWIKLNHAVLRVPRSRSWIEPKFACSCGLLANVMCTPFKPAFGWIVCAAKWKGTIYMCRFKDSEEEKINKYIPAKFTSWGFKFEQYMLSDSPHKDPDTSRPVTEGAEFRCIFQRTIGVHSVLFTAEMDGLDSRETMSEPLPLDKLRFVELKTMKTIDAPNKVRNFKRFKLVRWWAQSFLVGNEKIVVGDRDDDGIVHNLTTYTLPEIVEMSREYWDPARCVRQLRDFLDLVAKTVTDNCERTIYKFEKKPHREIVTTRVSPRSEYKFIPDSYLDATR